MENVERSGCLLEIFDPGMALYFKVNLQVPSTNSAQRFIAPHQYLPVNLFKFSHTVIAFAERHPNLGWCPVAYHSQTYPLIAFLRGGPFGPRAQLSRFRVVSFSRTATLLESCSAFFPASFAFVAVCTDCFGFVRCV